MGTTTTLLTFEEFERLPDDPDEPGKAELLDGELIQLPPAKLRHMDIAQKLFLLLLRFMEGGGFPGNLGEVRIEVGYKLGRRSWLVPDVSIAHPNHPSHDYLEGAPVLPIEVISEDHKEDHLHRKLKKYFAHGSTEVWVIYPNTQSVVIHYPGQAREYNGILTSDLLPGLSIDLTHLFAAPQSAHPPAAPPYRAASSDN